MPTNLAIDDELLEEARSHCVFGCQRTVERWITLLEPTPRSPHRLATTASYASGPIIVFGGTSPPAELQAPFRSVPELSCRIGYVPLLSISCPAPIYAVSGLAGNC